MTNHPPRVNLGRLPVSWARTIPGVRLPALGVRPVATMARTRTRRR